MQKNQAKKKHHMMMTEQRKIIGTKASDQPAHKISITNLLSCLIFLWLSKQSKKLSLGTIELGGKLMSLVVSVAIAHLHNINIIVLL